MSTTTRSRPSLEILAAISRDLVLLFAQLTHLATLELGITIGALKNGAVLATIRVALVVGGALALVAALILVAVAGGLPSWAAALAVGVPLMLGGAILLHVGVDTIRRVEANFSHTRAAVSEAVSWVKTLQR